MTCDFCHEREAVIFLEQVNGNGQKRKISICRECALAHGISPDPKSIESSIGDLFREINAFSRRIAAENSRMCPVCGMGIVELRKTGKAGCPECYAIFKDDIKNLLKKNGINGSYTGSMPERLSGVHSVLNDRIVLQNKLNDAVASEDYEKAAMYRDYLHALEKSPVSGGDDMENQPEQGGIDGGAE
ncbi:MAG: UvrB/UvrC motif-containing protein [Treponema sp.]|nr:UvrB/UvrC motif-containing protein [Treponema sp.]